MALRPMAHGSNMSYIFIGLILLAAGVIIFFLWKHYGKGLNVKLLGSKGRRKEKAILRLIQKEPKNPFHYKKLGALYIKRRQKSDAVEALKYAMKLNPTDMSIRELLEELEKK